MKKLMALIAALVMVSGLAYADDQWDFYGSARVSTFWNTIDANTAGVADVDQFDQALQGNSRIGATVKVSDEVGGGFEYGTTVNVRKLYGTWNFGSGSLKVGQDYTPLNWFLSNQVYGADSDLLFYGGIFSGRAAMLQLTMGGLKVALVDPATAGIAPFNTVEVKMPAIEVSYTMKMDALTLMLGGGYQTFEVTNAGGVNDDVVSYVVAVGGTVKVGPGYINADLFTGQNVGNLMTITTGGTNAVATANATSVLDNDALGYMIAAGAKINDMFAVEAGFGAVSVDMEAANTPDDDVTSYYVQATITLAPGVTITPEIGVIDFEETAQNKNTYFGAKWQINF
ncbi:MAG: hypothetical protein ABIJ59_19630 [Pseudomonadota bacterium]